MKFLFILLIVIIIAVPDIGHAICDLNGNGIEGEIADLIFLVNLYIGQPDNWSACDLNCNMDGDSDSLTIADSYLFVQYLLDPQNEPPYFGFNPAEDTIKVGSAQVSPGDLISLPVYLTTTDTLIAYELLLKVDSDYVAIDDFIPSNSLQFVFAYSPRLIHLANYNFREISDSLLIYPGVYYLGDLVVDINPDIDEPVTTHVEFVSCPDYNFYTGMANMTFFVPVLVDGEITITPTGIDDNHPNLPLATSIEAYPNPFNSSVNLRVQSDRADRLMIYDVLGREIAGFQVEAGLNKITWDATDKKGRNVNTGIYFARLQNNLNSEARKLLLIR